jgi:hypothetical protein
MAALIIQQHQNVPEQPGDQSSTKYEIHKQKKQQEKEKLDDLMSKLPPNTKRATQMACEKGALIVSLHFPWKNMDSFFIRETSKMH